MLHYLFSFEGRINRAKMWLFVPIPFVWFLVYLIGVPRLLPHLESEPFVVRRGVLLLWMVPVFYACIAVFVKRLHDRDMSGWWFLVFWGLPIALGIPGILYLWWGTAPDHLPMWVTACQWSAMAVYVWMLVELFLMRGTAGGNRFGSDPLAKAN